MDRATQFHFSLDIHHLTLADAQSALILPLLVEDGLNDARRILTEKEHELEALARGLLEYETLTGERFR